MVKFFLLREDFIIKLMFSKGFVIKFHIEISIAVNG